MGSPRNISVLAAWFTAVYDMLLNYWYQARFGDTSFVVQSWQSHQREALMSEPGLNSDGVKLLDYKSFP